MSKAGLTRRQTVRSLPLAVMSLGSASLIAIPLSAAQGAILPPGPMLLTRRLYRGLHDGKAIVVTRSWRVQFAPSSQGIAITGEQVAVSVDAPPALAPLTRIEETRSTQGMFPILLSSSGVIMAAGASTSQASFNAALDAAEQMMRARGASTLSVAEQRRFMAEIQQAGSTLLDEMPSDLFYPSAIPVREVRQITLADGARGEFELRWTASPQEQGPWLGTARREIITRIDGDERRSSEDWTMAPI